MKFWRKLTWEKFLQGFGMFVVLVAMGAEFPHVHWEGVGLGLGFIKASEYIPGGKR